MDIPIFSALLLFLLGVGYVNAISEDEYLGGGRTTLDLLVLLYLLRRRRNTVPTRSNRRYWVCPTNTRRREKGAWDNLVKELMQEEPLKFVNFHRMTWEQFNILLRMIEPNIQRRNYGREPIPAGLKLSLTLRYLAAGDSMVSLSYLYRIGKSTASDIIRETCLAIWEVLHPLVLKVPTQEEWAAIAHDFNMIWNFPNCVGAIDGKHVVVQCFDKTGSDFYNYEGSFSTSLLAIADAHYRFIFVSIGSKGRESDGGIFQQTQFGQDIARGRLPLPEPLVIEAFPVPLPPVFLGDQAFPLLPHLMRPFPSSERQLPYHRIFNYRHSRARRVIENAFGILASRFRLFRKPIICSATSVDAIVQACIVLHNWLRTKDIEESQHRYYSPMLVDHEDEEGILREGTWRQEPTPTGLVPQNSTTARNPTTRAKAIRDNLANYFMSVGQVLWQWQHLPTFQRVFI